MSNKFKKYCNIINTNALIDFELTAIKSIYTEFLFKHI